MNMYPAILSFAKIVENKSLSKAARDLGLQVPAISKHLQKLEEKLGATLVTRNTRTVNITPIGMEYFYRCQNILKSIEESQDLVIDYVNRKSGRVKVSIDINAACLVKELFTGFLNNNPDTRLILSEVDLFNSIIDIDSDFTVFISTGSIKNSDAIVRPIGSYQFSLYSSEQIKGAGDTLIEHSLMRKFVSEHPGITDSLSKLNLVNRYYCDDINLAADLVAQGFGLAVLPDVMIQADNKHNLHKVSDLDLSLDLMISYADRRYKTLLHREFIDNLL